MTNLSVGTHTVKAISNNIFYQGETIKTFTIQNNASLQIIISFIFRQTHYSECRLINNTNTCVLIQGNGSIQCQNIGGSCNSTGV